MSGVTRIIRTFICGSRLTGQHRYVYWLGSFVICNDIKKSICLHIYLCCKAPVYSGFVLGTLSACSPAAGSNQQLSASYKKEKFILTNLLQSSAGKMLTLGVVKDTLEPDTPFLLSQLSRVDIVLLGEIIENEHAMNDKQNFTFDHLTTHYCLA